MQQADIAPAVRGVEKFGESGGTAAVRTLNLDREARANDTCERPFAPGTRKQIFQAVAGSSHLTGAQWARRQTPTGQIGFHNEGGWMDFRSPFFSQLITGMYEGCYATRRALLLNTPCPYPPLEDRHLSLTSGILDGLIVRSGQSDPLLPLLAASGFPVVAIVDALPNLPSVVSDDAAGGRAIAEHLASLGHQRIFFQRSDLPHLSVARRLAALQEEDSPWRLTVEVGIVPDGKPGGMCPELQAALSRPAGERPTAVVCWNDYNAQSVLQACRERGLRVPGDLAIVGYDNSTPLAEGRRITSVRADWGAVAREAVYCLTALLDGNEVPRETVLPSRLIPGDTT